MPHSLNAHRSFSDANFATASVLCTAFHLLTTKEQTRTQTQTNKKHRNVCHAKPTKASVYAELRTAESYPTTLARWLPHTIAIVLILTSQPPFPLISLFFQLKSLFAVYSPKRQALHHRNGNHKLPNETSTHTKRAVGMPLTVHGEH